MSEAPAEYTLTSQPTGKEWRRLSEGGMTVAVTDAGVWLYRKSEEKKGWRRIGRYGVMPIAVIEDEDTGRVWARLRFRAITGKIKEVVIPIQDLARFASGRSEASDQGFTAPNNHHALVEALQFLLDVGVRQKIVEEIRGTSLCGWNGDRFVRPGDASYAGNAQEMVHQAGDRAVWIETMGDLLKESPIAALACAQAVGGYMRGVVNNSFSSMLSLYGETSNGKTLASLVAVSWQASPAEGRNRPFADAGSTAVGMESGLEWNRHGFFVINEAQRLPVDHGRGRGRVSHLMYLAEGGDRLRGTAAESRSWNTSMLITTNTPLAVLAGAVGDDQEHALAARMIEIDTTQKGVDVWTWRDGDKAQRIKDIFGQHHGFGMPLVINDIRERKPALLETYREVITATTEAIDRDRTLLGTPCPLSKTGAGVVSRQAEMIGLMECGLDIIEEVLAIELDEAKMALDDAWEAVWMSYRLDVEDGWQDQVISFLKGNLARTIVIGHLHPAIDGYSQMSSDKPTNENDQKWAAEEHNQRVRKSRGEPWLLLQNVSPMADEDDWKGIIWVLKAGIEGGTKSGRNFGRMAEKALDAGGLKQGSKSEAGRKVLKAPKGYGRGYGFLIAGPADSEPPD